MSKQEIEAVIEALKTGLASSEQQWDNKIPHAQIVGYLQGTIEVAISHLEGKIK